MEKFFCCFVEASGGFHKRHKTFQDASIEAERLAKQSQNLGRNVYILEATSYCRTVEVPIEWQKIH